MGRLFRLAIVALLFFGLGCAHRIDITPALDALNVSGISKIDKNVGYYISPEKIAKEVETPAGGGDKVKYLPYKESEPALNRVLSNVFREVYALPSPGHAEFIESKNISYIFVPTITTDSSARSFATWPPSDFTVSLDCKATDASGRSVWETSLKAEAHEPLQDVRRDPARAGKVALQKAFLELQSRIVSIEAPVAKENAIPFRTYRTVTVSKMSADGFWAKNAGRKSDEKWTDQVNRAAEHISGTLTKYFAAEWKGEADRQLKIEADLFEFDPGSQAARYFLGAGLGEGRIGYHVTLRDGATSEVVGQLDAYGTVLAGVFGGDIATAYDQCANAVIEYVKAKR